MGIDDGWIDLVLLMFESIWIAKITALLCVPSIQMNRCHGLFYAPGLLESAKWIRIDSCVSLPLDKSWEFLWEDQVKVGSMFNLEVERQGLIPLHKKNNQWKRSKITAMVPWLKTLDSAHIYQLISLLPLAIFVSLFVVLK